MLVLIIVAGIYLKFNKIRQILFSFEYAILRKKLQSKDILIWKRKQNQDL